MRANGELFCGDVGQNVNKTRQLFDQIGDEIRCDATVQQHLVSITGLLTAVDVEMHRLELATLCSACAAEPGGGCCFAGMAAEAEVVVLTINQLLGCTVSQHDSAADECCFLGQYGCTLRCKPIFCLSYTCPKMNHRYSRRALAALDAACARALREQLSLEHRLQQLLLSLRT